MSGELAGRTAIISGASQGLGFAIAEAYIDAGAAVAITARSRDPLAEAAERLARRAGNASRIFARVADVSVPEDAEGLVADAVQHFGSVEILVNNAGVYGPMGRVEDVDWSEWMQALAVNLLGSVLMARAIVPRFRERHYGKIVQLSGGGATAPLPRFSAYATSKAAIVRFAETLAEEVREDGVDVNAIAPGALNTRLLDDVLAAGPERVGTAFYDRALRQRDEGGAPLERGAALAVFLASARSDGVTGKILSALWDPWENLADHRATLAESDVYTLRRIVPDDRGLQFEPPASD